MPGKDILNLNKIHKKKNIYIYIYIYSILNFFIIIIK